MTQLQAIGTKVVVKKTHTEAKSKGGLILAHSEDPNPLAEIISIGADIKDAKFAAGDQAYISWPNTAKAGDYFIVDYASIFAICKND